jgi:putative acetyltransferase
MDLRFEEPGDQDAIRAVHAASFPTAGEARVVDALRAAGSLCLSLVAVDNGKIVGHVAFSPVTVAGATDGVGLAPVAVLPACRRRGIAEKLIREGLELCERLEFGFVVVLGDPTYYCRCGFLPAGGWGLVDEYGGGESFQALELRAASIPTGGGLVRYAPEFAVVDGTS